MSRLQAWGPVAAWCAVIFGFSSITGSGGRDLLWTAAAKTAHFVEYFILAGLVRRAGLSRPATVLFCLAYAVSDEWHQSFVPGRRPSALDVLIDGAGALTAARLRAILSR